MKTSELFPQRMGKLLRERNMDSEALSQRTGIPIATIRAYLCGKRDAISTRNLLLFAQAFELPMSELVDYLNDVVNLDKK